MPLRRGWRTPQESSQSLLIEMLNRHSVGAAVGAEGEAYRRGTGSHLAAWIVGEGVAIPVAERIGFAIGAKDESEPVIGGGDFSRPEVAARISAEVGLVRQCWSCIFRWMGGQFRPVRLCHFSKHLFENCHPVLGGRALEQIVFSGDHHQPAGIFGQGEAADVDVVATGNRTDPRASSTTWTSGSPA